jgi:hypothetical protein
VKLTKKSWLFIGIGIFLIALVGLWTVYSQQSGVKKQLKEEYDMATSRLNSIQVEQLADQQGELEQQLDDTIAQSKTARKTLSEPMNSIIITDILFSTADSNSVNITEIQSSGMNDVELEGVPCRVLPLTANIEGEVGNLVAFITQLNDDLATGVVRSVDMNIPYTAGGEKPSASIQMVFYTYEER